MLPVGGKGFRLPERIKLFGFNNKSLPGDFIKTPVRDLCKAVFMPNGYISAISKTSCIACILRF